MKYGDKFNIKKFKSRKNAKFSEKDIVNCKVLCFLGIFVFVGVSPTSEAEVL